MLRCIGFLIVWVVYGVAAAQVVEDVISVLKTNLDFLPGYKLKTQVGVLSMVEVFNCSGAEVLSDLSAMQLVLTDALSIDGVKEISCHSVTKKKQELDVLSLSCLLEEDWHISVDSYPTLKYVSIEIYANEPPKNTLEYLAEKFQGKLFISGTMPRGIPKDVVQVIPTDVIGTSELSINQIDQIATSRMEMAHAYMMDLLKNSSVAASTPFDCSFDLDEKAQRRSDHHVYDVMHNSKGKVDDRCILVDGEVWTCTSFGQTWAEILIHLPLSYSLVLQSALVVGPDLLILKELLKYGPFDKLVVLVRDESLLEYQKRYLFEGKDDFVRQMKGFDEIEWIVVPGEYSEVEKRLDKLIETHGDFDLVVYTNIEAPVYHRMSIDGENTALESLANLVSNAGIMVHASNHYGTHIPGISHHFNEFLETLAPLPVVGFRRILVTSNACSLMFPRWKQFKKRNIGGLLFWKADDATERLRQLRALVKKYTKKGLDYIQGLIKAEDAFRASDALYKQEHEGECRDPMNLVPCFKESRLQGTIILQDQWKDDPCEVLPNKSNIRITIENRFNAPIDIYWYNFQTKKGELLLANLRNGFRQRIDSFLGHRFLVHAHEEKIEHVAVIDVMYQHVSHSTVTIKDNDGKVVVFATSPIAG